MRLLFSLTLILSFTVVYAQIANVPGVGNEVLRTSKYVDISGSPYLYEDWKSGTVTDKGGKTFPNVLIKFDAYKNVVEINQNGEVMLLSNELYPKFSISFVPAGSNTVVNQFFQCGFEGIEGISNKVYLEVLRNGAVQILKKYEIIYEENIITNYGTSSIRKNFQKKERYFLKTSGKYVEVKLNSKSILEALGSLKKVADQYLSDNKFKIKTESNLLLLIDHLNSL